MKARDLGLGSLLALLLVAGLWSRSLDTYFLKDDLSLAMFAGEDGTLNWDGLVKQLLWPTERTWDDIWRPIPALSWALDWHLYGVEPRGWNATQIFIHLLNTLLIGTLLHRLARAAGAWPVMAAMLGFGLYPLHAEAVLWKTQRTVLMGLLFSLICVHLALSYARRGGMGRLVAIGLTYALGLLSREHAAGLPVLLVLVVWWYTPSEREVGEPRGIRWGLREALKVGAVTAPVLALYFAGRYAIFGRLSGGYSGWPSMQAYAKDLGIIEALPETVRLMLFPFNAFWFDRPALDAGSPLRWSHLLMVITGVGIALGLWASLRHGRSGLKAWVVALVWAALAWLPVVLVFRVFPTLANARSATHIVALIPAVAAYYLATVRPRWLVGLLLLPWTLSLAFQQESFARADRQVRNLRSSAALIAEQNPGTRLLGFGIPNEVAGAVTVDAYWTPLLAPPFTKPGVEAVPLVLGLQSTWAGILEKQRSDPRRDLLLVANPEDGMLRPLLEPVAPNEGEELRWVVPFPAPLQWGGGKPLEFSVFLISAARFELELSSGAWSGTYAMRIDQGSGVATLATDALGTGPSPLPWPLPEALFPPDRPLMVKARAKAYDEEGKVVATTSSLEIGFLMPPKP